MDISGTPEIYDVTIRRNFLFRFREYFDNGYLDPDLLYLGARFALSLGLIEEAKRFLEPLEDMFKENDKFSSAYLPVGLLKLLCLSDDKEKSPLLEILIELAKPVTALKQLLEDAKEYLTKKDQVNPPALESLEHVFTYPLKAISDELFKQVFPAAEDLPGSPSKDLGKVPESREEELAENNQLISRFYNSSQIAFQAYLDDDLVKAQQALEAILLVDGDQPDVVRNLITIASELKDINTYERYWRRYVKVLLWRILRGDDSHTAWQDLLLFYSKIATVMDRECSKTLDKTVKIIRRPGFLPKWMEAHTALIWLESATKSRRDLQTGVDSKKMGQSILGNLAIMKHWFRVFYPEFYPYLTISPYTQTYTPFYSTEVEILALQFNPSRRLVLRFLEWAEFHFGIQEEEGPLTEAIIALATFVAQVPLSCYAADKKIVKTVTEKEFQRKSVHQAVRDACGIAFGLKLRELLNNDNWQGVIDFFDVPDYYKNFSSSIFLFLAFAYCHIGAAAKALNIACHSLPILTKEDLEDDSQAFNLWQQVIVAHVSQAFSMEESANALKLIEKVKMQVSNVSTPAPVKPFKENIIAIIESNSVFVRARELIGKSEFAEAHKIVTGLPDKFPAIKNQKNSFLEQIEQAEKHHRLQEMIEGAMEQAKKYVEKGKFEAARYEINKLPDQPEQIEEIKNNILKQIDEAEENYVDHTMVETVIENAKKHASNGEFSAARWEINRLPDKPRQIRELKSNFLQQINEAEENYVDNALIERTIEMAKKHVEKSEFGKARSAVHSLPDKPAQIKDLKSSLMSQINELERSEERMDDEIKEIFDRLSRKGVNFKAIGQIASDNNIDLSDKRQLHALLKAVEAQL